MTRQNNGNGMVYQITVLETFGYGRELEEAYAEWHYQHLFVAGCYYVGQHWLPEGMEPFEDGYLGSGYRVRAFFMYLEDIGVDPLDAIDAEVLHHPIATVDELNALGYQEVGNKYDTDPLCLNCKEGGHQSLYSEDTRRRLSEAAKKAHGTPEARRRHSEEQKKYFRENPEAREHFLEAHKNRCKDPEYRRRLSESIMKSHADPEIKKRHLGGCQGLAG